MRNNFDQLYSQRGFSLIQMLVAIVISGIIIAGLTSTMTSGWSMMAKQSSKLGQIVLAEDIRTELATNARCSAAVTSATREYKPNSKGRADINLNFENGIQVRQNQDLHQYDVHVDSLEFVRGGPPTNLSGGRLSHFGELELKVSGGTGNMARFKPMLLGKLELITDSRGRILECGTSSDAIAEMCDSIGGSLQGTRCQLPTPSCVPKTGTWTWCGSSCPSGQPLTESGEKWDLKKMVGGPVRNTGCRRAGGYQVTCRYEISCPNGSYVK